jgi:large subunit ribosomal protein L28
MARVCELTGKGPLYGNLVSHANNKTRRRFLPNLVAVTLHSEGLGRKFRMRICAQTLKTVEHRGGFDGYLLKARSNELEPKALKIKRDLVKKLAETAPAEKAA